VNILLVDDQPGKLLSYEVVLAELGENLIKASSGKEALKLLLRYDIAVVLVGRVHARDGRLRPGQSHRANTRASATRRSSWSPAST
jgi:DNA-binding NarL/FixJ family response regulator